MTRFGLDIPGPTAVIIGDNYKTGRLFYDGREQSGSFSGDTDAELREAAKARKMELRERLGESFARVYPDDSKWELRIWD